MITQKITGPLDGFRIAGISVRTTNQNDQAQSDIGALWERFIIEDVAKNIPGKLSDDIYSVYTDYESDHTGAYTTVLGCKVSDTAVLPDGFTSLNIPTGQYEVNKVEGEMPESVINAWQQIWQNGANRIYTTDFEVYGCEEEGLKIYLAVG